MYPVDLHSHTTASDGLLSPSRLVQHAAERGVQVLAITDHDTMDGVPEAQQAGDALGMTIVPGIEFSTRHEEDKMFVGIHLLGYFIDPHHPTMIEMVRRVRESRVQQKVRQIELMQSFGFNITVEEVFALVDGVPGRPHIAQIIEQNHPGRFKSTQQIYEEYLGAHKKAHVRREFALTVADAIALIKQVGGMSVFAHPWAYGESVADPLQAVRNAARLGVDGVEVHYAYDKPQAKVLIKQMDDLADELNLLKTGGTDFHGRPSDYADLGDMGLSIEQFQSLKEAIPHQGI